jgi:hypothetical protein
MKMYFCLFLITILTCAKVTGQETPEINLKKYYYINANQSHSQSVYDIQDQVFGIQYTDNYGLTPTIELKIFDSGNELVGRFTLDKIRGVNQYAMDLKNLTTKVQMESVYYCSMKDENGFEYRWTVRPVEKPKVDLDITLSVNAKQLSCGGATGNLVEFTGSVTNGRGPYSFSWYVMDESKSQFLYQPKNDLMETSGGKSLIEVDKSPGYYVMLDVTDACGGIGRKMVYIECQKNRKKINTFFVEPLPNSSKHATTTQ